MIFNDVVALNKLLEDGIVATARRTEYRVGQKTFIKTSEDLARQLFGSAVDELKKDKNGRIVLGRAEVIEAYEATEENFRKLAEQSGYSAEAWMELAKRLGKPKWIYVVKLVDVYVKSNKGKVITLLDFIGEG